MTSRLLLSLMLAFLIGCDEGSNRLIDGSEVASGGRLSDGEKLSILIGDRSITINNKPVEIGQPLASWKTAISGSSRCETQQRREICVWDEAGVEVLAEDSAVIFFHVYFNKIPWGPYPTETPDGKPFPEAVDTRPNKTFDGVFKIDGFEINSRTEFRQIRKNVSPSRNVRCDLFTGNCANTTARFDERSNIYIELNGTTSPKGNLAVFAIGGSPAEKDAEPERNGVRK